MKFTAVYRVVLGAALACSGPVRGADLDETQGRVRTAVGALASGDPAKRERATRTLLELGTEARRAVFEASRSDDPELRARASELLLKLPWYLPDDSPAVRQLLNDYGQLGVDKRRDVVNSLSELTQHGYDALLRLIEEEPSDDVKWAVVAGVRRVYHEGVLEGFRRLDTDVDSAPLLAAAGHAWMPKDAARGAKLLRQALSLDLERPANDGGEVEAAYERLQNLALLAGRYDEVAQLLRLRAQRDATDDEGEASQAVLNLFAAHAKFGPLKGFDKDLQTYQARLSDPRVMFALGKAYERCGQRALADATFRAAFLVDLVSVGDRFTQGEFLMHQGWHDLAQAQFAAVFDLADDHSTERPQMTPELDMANAHFRLGQIAAARDEDQAAGEHIQKAMELHFKGGGMLRGATELSLRQEIDWHHLRAARAKGDQAEVARRLQYLISPAPVNPDVANDVVPMLRDAGREKEAKAVFDEVYQTLQQSWGTMADHPMPKNNLAWLSARCGERKDEALRLALEATRAMPDNAAFVDTLAEAHFQLGHYRQAVELETRVVAARPNDHFLQNQLKRFEDAAAATKTKGE